jgi:hyperosmotically inducible protein
METRSKWSVAAFIAAAAVLAAGCDSHHEVDTAQPLKIASAGVAAKSSDDPAVGSDQVVEDSALTITVRSAILADKELQSQHIKVESEDAAVTLTGAVDSQALRERAVEIAESVDGVAQVEDRLRVRN